MKKLFWIFAVVLMISTTASATVGVPEASILVHRQYRKAGRTAGRTHHRSGSCRGSNGGRSDRPWELRFRHVRGGSCRI